MSATAGVLLCKNGVLAIVFVVLGREPKVL